MNRSICATAMTLVMATGLAAIAAAQPEGAAKTPLTFELASIKPSQPGAQGGIVHQMPGNQTYEVLNMPLRVIMTVAYSVTDRQISGGPEWMNSTPWDIQAKADRRGTNDEMHDALARLLEDRFHLKVRHETRDLPVYLLTVDKQGARMPEHDAADIVHEPFRGNPVRGMTGNNVTMNYFAFVLSRIMELNVLDRTGLSAHYDVKLQFIPEQVAGPGRGGDGGGAEVRAVPEGPDIYTALRQQLGLRIEKGRGPVDFLVVEHVEKPTDN